jgi:hypothetical protein
VGRGVAIFAACALSALVAGSGGALSGCDQGHQDDQPSVGSVPVNLVSQNVDAHTPVPANGNIELGFDRFLDPATVNRQGFVLADASGNAIAFAALAYDPVVRKVTIEPMGGLVAGQPYTLTLPVWPHGVESGGVRATDGAPLSAPLEIGFMASAAGTAPSVTTVSFCGDILPVFQRSCSVSSCHGAPAPGADPTRTGSGSSYPAEGLALSTGPWVQTSAIDGLRPAVGDNSGPSGVSDEGIAGLFGVNMPIIDPNNAANSWLLYKCLISPLGIPVATADAGSDAGAGVDAGPGHCGATAVSYSTATTAASDDERARLAEQIQGAVSPTRCPTSTAPRTSPRRSRSRSTSWSA